MQEPREVLNHGSRGYTSTIFKIPSTPTRVCKAFNADRITDLFPVEKQVYERFASSPDQPPPSILKYYGVHATIPAGLILEYAENCDIWSYIWHYRESRKRSGSDEQDEAPNDIDPRLLYRWASQAAEGLAFAHGCGVYNADIHCVNLFLDSDLNLKVGDWAGASVDGSISRSSYRLRHRLFDSAGTDVARQSGISVSTEIFALGTALWDMVTGELIWPELKEPENRAEIRRRIAAKEWPSTDGLPCLGSIIRQCWEVKFHSMRDVQDAIDKEREIRHFL